MTGAFRNGWQGDYPALYNFLQPQYATGADANKGGYSNSEFDSLVTQASSATSSAEAAKTLEQAQTILLRDMPAVPLWYTNANGAWSKNVDNVKFDWKGQPVFWQITKKQLSIALRSRIDAGHTFISKQHHGVDTAYKLRD